MTRLYLKIIKRLWVKRERSDNSIGMRLSHV